MLNSKVVTEVLTDAALAYQEALSAPENRASITVCLEAVSEEAQEIFGEMPTSTKSDACAKFSRRVGKLYVPLDAVTKAVIARRCGARSTDERAETRRIFDRDLYANSAYETCTLYAPPGKDDPNPTEYARVHMCVCDLMPTTAYAKEAAAVAVEALQKYLMKDKDCRLYVEQ